MRPQAKRVWSIERDERGAVIRGVREFRVESTSVFSPRLSDENLESENYRKPYPLG